MSQPGFFDLSDRYEQLSRLVDPLERLDAVMDWELFLPLIHRAFDKQRKSAAGRKPYHRLLMLKILILQTLYNLSDHQMEYQIRDRLSFMRFLGLPFEDSVPDEKTIWSFREVLVQSHMMEKLLARFDRYLAEQGFSAKTGMIVDASIVEVPRQRNSRDDNQKIKEGKIPMSFTDHPFRCRQKDVDARWTKKANETYYGYKNHLHVDVQHKLIRQYWVTPASTGDVTCLVRLIHGVPNQDRQLWADGAYDSDESQKLLARYHIKNRIIHRVRAGRWITEPDARENRRRAKIRKRIEHVFGFMENSMNGKFIRTIGLLRARGKIGLMNLVYNLCRFEQLERFGVA